jgi:hypothetical protein
MTEAIRFNWYDLPDNGRDQYCHWLHETRIPELLARPGMRWGAHYAGVPNGAARTIRRDGVIDDTGEPDLPQGSAYILMLAGDHANVFDELATTASRERLPGKMRDMLGLRIGERINVMIEAARVEAGYAQDSLSVPAPCIQLGNFNYPWRHEPELLQWFSQWRMPAIVRQAGCPRVRKYASVTGWAKHAILYEWISLEARNRGYLTHEDGVPDMKAWSDRVVARTVHAPGSATLATRLWPPLSQ